MTHTLHRRPLATEGWRDWVVLAMAAQGPHRVGAAPRLRRFLSLARRHAPVNLGDMRSGSILTTGFDTIVAQVDEASIVHAVFADESAARALLAELAAADLGLSVVVTGAVTATERCCREVGLRPHTVALSLGVTGRVERLPEAAVLEITTQCGHGAIAAPLVLATADAVGRSGMSLDDGVERLGRPCVCGVFNPELARHALARLAAQRARTAEGRAPSVAAGTPPESHHRTAG